MKDCTYPGKLIVFDGMDGSGKGSMIALTVEYLRGVVGQLGIVETKEPGGTPVGDGIRRVLFEDGAARSSAPGVVDLLFLASHIQNWRTVVEPALRRGAIVVSDRWPYSQEAYSTQRQVPETIARAYWVESGCYADLLILLHGTPSILIGRANRRIGETHQASKSWNDLETLSKIQQAYIDLFSRRPEFCPISVDDLSPTEVWLAVKEKLDGFLGLLPV